MGIKVIKLLSKIITLVAVLTVSTASLIIWHNPVPEELLKKKSK
ncbi:cyclic lactone autoinducer peptide [Paenibacillus sp. 598K]